VLGENGLPYWQALVSFLTGKIGREELDGLVDGWLGGPEKRLSQYTALSLSFSVW
jgi:hypothetical protein